MQIESIEIRGIEFGKGMPKVCIPIVATTEEEVQSQLEQIMLQQPDCIEFRGDWFQGIFQPERTLAVLEAIRKRIGNVVLLFTFRTKGEGGKQTIPLQEYLTLGERVCASGYIDMLDVEFYLQDNIPQQLCQIAHSHGVYVVASSHDFERTPEEEIMVERLRAMERMGADFPKLAVMPQRERDVLQLLSATLQYYETGGHKPVITMSMAGMGSVSRLTGELMGSAMTFATAGMDSAPGQMPIEDVRQTLQLLHQSMKN